MNRTVRRMTRSAVFGDRRVFPHEGSALVGMTHEARVIGRLLREQSLVDSAVYGMTSGTGHLAVIDGMRVRAVYVHARDLVTGAADRGLRRRLEDGIPSRMTAVTAGARNFILRMRTRVPTRADLRLVTGRAQAVLHRHRRL